MTRIRSFMLVSLMATIILWSGCGDSGGGETPNGMAGTWRLTSMAFSLDGNLLTSMNTSGYQATFDDTSFTYRDTGQKSGNWLINEEETELTIEFESSSQTFPVVSKSDTELSITIRTVDLSNDSPSAEDAALFRLINQRLNETGSNWSTASASAQTLTVVFNLTKS